MKDLFYVTTAAEVEKSLARGANLEEERISYEDEFEVFDVGETPLTSAIMRGNKDVFFSLLQHGADPNHRPRRVKSPIQWAASMGWKDMVEALAKAGANINEYEDGREGDGSSLCIAADIGAVDVTEALLALGADTEIKNWRRTTPLMAASYKGHEVIVDRLLAAGATVYSEDNERESPLIKASVSGHLGIVDRLVIHGANINHQNKRGRNALMLACWFGHAPVVDRLVGLGCDLNLQNNDGKTALMWACEKERVEIVKILLAHGADIQIEDNEGKRAIDLTQSQEIKDLLQEHESKKP